MQQALASRKQADTGRVHLLFQLAEHFTLKPGEAKADMDSAHHYIQQGFTLSQQLSYPYGICYSHLLLSAVHRESGDAAKGQSFAEKAIDLCQQHQQYHLLGKSYIELSQFYTPYDSAGFFKIQGLYQQAVPAFKQGNNIKEQADCLKYLADLDGNVSDDPTLAISLLHQALSLYRSINYPELHGVYDLFGFIYSNNSDYTSAVKYGLLAVQTAEKVGDSSIQLSTIFNRLGRSYYLLKDYPPAKNYFLKAWENAHRLKNGEYVVEIAPNVINGYIKLGEYTAALHFLNHLRRQYSANYKNILVDEATINSFYVVLYSRLKNYAKAGEYARKITDHKGSNFPHLKNPYDLNRIAPYYIETRQFNLAKICLDAFNERIKGTNTSHDRGISEVLWFRLDSASGNYLSAIEHYKNYKAFEDSIFQADKSKLMAMTRVEYETARKDQEITTKNESIQLLTKTNEVQQKQINQSKLLQNMTFALIGLLVVVFGLLYNQYRIKRRNNEEVRKKNLNLERLVQEKEWLLKEVHHRVKNNLHTIISLLESQSAYLQNDALAAIQNSQNRVYAMSLIHQKLYMGKNITNIDMSVYIPELVHYLQNSFDGRQRIRFHTEADKIWLDISQAIPVGLIINEAITNSIKYAFPGHQHGLITTQLLQTGDNKILLLIADNGVGLPTGMDYEHLHSLGLKMMKGLSEDLRAGFSIDGSNGTQVTVIFEENHLMREGKTETVASLS